MAVREGTKTLTTKGAAAAAAAAASAPTAAEPAEVALDHLTQRKRPELGRYLLQVDRQTKGSYTDYAAAEVAAVAIKTKHPIVQVTVHDAAEGVSKVVELPGA